MQLQRKQHCRCWRLLLLIEPLSATPASHLMHCHADGALQGPLESDVQEAVSACWCLEDKQVQVSSDS